MDGHGRQNTGTESFCRVIAMCSVRSFLLVVILAVGSAQIGRGQDKPGGPAEAPPATTQLNTQLRVNKEALFTQGSVEAATVMLEDEDPNARAILLEALKQSGNSQARIAVCNALILAREANKSIKNDQDFFCGNRREN